MAVAATAAKPSTEAAYRHIEVRRISGALGAEIHGVDLARDLDDETFAEIHRALLENCVIFFRNQNVTPDQHKAFGRRFGTLNVHPIYKPLPGHPEILPVVKEASDRENIGGTWHSDVTFLEAPPMGSILYALDTPPYGGDTMFANQYLAFETLSDGMKSLLGSLRAVHSDRILSDPESKRRRNAARSTKLEEETDPAPPVENMHPVVRTHPETGRKCLFVNAPFTVRFEGMTEEESRPLLHFLFDHSVRPELTCRFRWENGSIAFWDNRCAQHFALNDYHGFRREMHRVTIDGDRPY